MQLTTSMKRALRGLLCLAAAPMLMGSECEQPLVQDSSFDVWCGDTLCDWHVDAGGVTKVPTWHERDYGVGLDGDPVEISQALPFTSDDLSCIHFDLLANVDDSTNVVLTMDFDGGAFAVHETIPSGAWTPLSYHLVTPSYFQSLRLSIRKTGAGNAALAQIQASKASDCSGPPPVGELARPVGATCETVSQCAGAMCRARTAAGTLFDDDTGLQVCAACTTDADCGAGMVCGLGWSATFIQPFPACAPRGGGGGGRPLPGRRRVRERNVLPRRLLDLLRERRRARLHLRHHLRGAREDRRRQAGAHRLAVRARRRTRRARLRLPGRRRLRQRRVRGRRRAQRLRRRAALRLRRRLSDGRAR